MQTTYTTPCNVRLVLADNMVVPTTACCGATGKGSVADGSPAVVCRACYTVVDDAYGACASGPTMWHDVASIIEAIASRRCHDPAACAHEVLWNLTERGTTH